jgi:hypothetical protein
VLPWGIETRRRRLEEITADELGGEGPMRVQTTQA